MDLGGWGHLIRLDSENIRNKIRCHVYKPERIQSEFGKMHTRKIPNMNTFNAVLQLNDRMYSEYRKYEIWVYYLISS